MTTFIDSGRVKACIRRLVQAGRTLASEQADLERLEQGQLSIGGTDASNGSASSDLANARERVDRAKQDLKGLRGEAQRFLGDVRRAVSASRQDLGGLEQVVQSAGAGRAGLEGASRWRRRDLDQLQALQRELEAALSSTARVDNRSSGITGGDPYLTGTAPVSGHDVPSSPSLSAIEDAVFRSRRGQDGLEGRVSSSPGYRTSPSSRSQDFDHYAIPGAERFNRLWVRHSRGASAQPFDDLAAAYYHYRKNHSLSDRATDARQHVQHSVDLFSRGGRGFSGRYEI